jgi:hypothetical protein
MSFTLLLLHFNSSQRLVRGMVACAPSQPRTSRTVKRLGVAVITTLFAVYILLLAPASVGETEVHSTTHAMRQAQAASAVPTGPPHFSEDGSVAIVRTLPHPSCIALQQITQYVPSNAPLPKVAVPRGSPKGPRPTVTPLSNALEYWREYARPDFNCFKHGGHYNPGMPRSGGPEDARYREQLRRLVLKDVHYWNGEWYLQVPPSKAVGTLVLPYAAYFPMVSGNWPQPIVDRITLQRVHALPWEVGDAVRVQQQRVGYLQPPTDYLSVYHVAVETIFPTFHMLYESGLSMGDIAVVTSRPRATAYSFHERGCAVAFDKCLNTVWGAMFLSLTIADTPTSIAMLSGALTPSDVLSQCRRNDTRACVYGLTKKDQQLRYDIPASRAFPFVADIDRGVALRFDKLYVGNPTHCEPLWGGDPHYAEVVAQAHGIRGAGGIVGRGVNGNHTFPKGSLSAEQLATFSSSYHSCQATLRAFRNYFVQLAVPVPSILTPLSAGRTLPVSILITSRKDDWARQLLDEDEIVALLRKHLDLHYPRGSTVRAVKFHGALTSQLKEQLDVEHTTLFIGNHGANLLNSLFLRPNAGLVTLSLRNPGFYPFSVFPEWLHVRDLVVEQMCNRRLFKGKCRWMDGNNNDMFLSEAQRVLLLSHVDDIIGAQGDAQRQRR